MKFLKYGNPKKITAGRVVAISIVTSFFDVLINGFAALITGSVVMFAETLQGVADLVSSVLVFIGLKRAKLKPTNKHPFGYGREAFFWTLMASLVMFFVLAGLSFYFGLKNFLDPDPVDFIFLTIIILLVSVISNSYSLSVSLRRIITQGDNSSFWNQFSRSAKTETKTTLILDTIGTLSALSGLTALSLYYFTGDMRFDGIGAMVIGIFMAVFSIFLFSNAKDFLIGRSVSEREKRKIKESVLEFSEVNKILDLKAVSFGSDQILVHIQINAKDDLVTDQIEGLIDRIEQSIRKKVPSAKYIQIEMESSDKR